MLHKCSIYGGFLEGPLPSHLDVVRKPSLTFSEDNRVCKSWSWYNFWGLHFQAEGTSGIFNKPLCKTPPTEGLVPPQLHCFFQRNSILPHICISNITLEGILIISQDRQVGDFQYWCLPWQGILLFPNKINWESFKSKEHCLLFYHHFLSGQIQWRMSLGIDCSNQCPAKQLLLSQNS